MQFVRWGFDYVKVDWCGGYKDDKGSLDPAVQYAAIARAIERAEKITGHCLYYSICDWGKDSPWTWAPGIGGVDGDIWRTSGDIVPPIVANTTSGSRKASFTKVLDNFDQGVHPQAQHTGFYNDPDMMVVGMPALSDQQNRIHMSLWAISGAPLIVGADLTKLSQATLAILTNPEIIAIDQDTVGVQAIKVAEPIPGLQVWAKPLDISGEHAVLLLNRTSAPAHIDISWNKIGLDPSASATVRDLWAGKDLGSFLSSYASTIPASDAVVLIIRGTDGKAVRYEAASSANELSGGATPERCKNCSDGRSIAIGGEKSLTFRIAPMNGSAYIQIFYINRNKNPLIAELRVNGQIPTNILFPSTGEGEEVEAVTVEIECTKAARKNTLTFTSPSAPRLVLESISVLAGDY